MTNPATPASVKIINPGGKRHTGRKAIVPANENWIHHPKATTDLRKALKWARANKPSDMGLDITLEHLKNI